MKPLVYSLAVLVTLGISIGAHAGAAAPAAPGCLTPGTWNVPDGDRYRATTSKTLLTAIAKRDVVLLGESHGEDDHHRWQLQALAALYVLRSDMVIGFEMFPRRLQPVLERWVAGELTLTQFLKQSEWETVWNLPFDLYLPLFQFARINRIPMVALNIDHQLSKTIYRKGWDAVPPSEREGVGRAAPPSTAYREFLFKMYGQHMAIGGGKSTGGKSDDAFNHFVESQTTWDRAMAEALAHRVLPGVAGRKPLVVGIIGSGHLHFGYGVPYQLHDLGVNNVGTLLPLDADTDCKKLRAGLADAVFALPLQTGAKPEPEPPRLGVQLEQQGDAIQIIAIIAGSLADRTGIKSGDRLLLMGGIRVKKVESVVAMVGQQPAGSWLPLRLQRGNATLDLVVKFPPRAPTTP